MEKRAMAVREEQWLQTIAAAKQSGQPIKVWCAEYGVSVSSFYKWQRKTRDSLLAEEKAEIQFQELENLPLQSLLEEKFQLPVFLANDMHYKVYGYCRQEGLSDQIVTLVNYPSGVLPGTATVHKGVLLAGRNLFAGMVGFLDYGMSLEQQIQRLHRPDAEPLIIQASIALISILNPHKLLFTGDLLQESDLGRIRTACRRCIPEEYMPDFVFIPSTDYYYQMGMYWTAMGRKDGTT